MKLVSLIARQPDIVDHLVDALLERMDAGVDVRIILRNEGDTRAMLQALKTYGMLLSDGGNVALTFADDRTTTAKWSGVGITAQSFAALKVDDFEVVDLSPEIALTDNCVRNP